MEADPAAFGQKQSELPQLHEHRSPGRRGGSRVVDGCNLVRADDIRFVARTLSQPNMCSETGKAFDCRS